MIDGMETAGRPVAGSFLLKADQDMLVKTRVNLGDLTFLKTNDNFSLSSSQEKRLCPRQNSHQFFQIQPADTPGLLLRPFKNQNFWTRMA